MKTTLAVLAFVLSFGSLAQTAEAQTQAQVTPALERVVFVQPDQSTRGERAERQAALQQVVAPFLEPAMNDGVEGYASSIVVVKENEAPAAIAAINSIPGYRAKTVAQALLRPAQAPKNLFADIDEPVRAIEAIDRSFYRIAGGQRVESKSWFKAQVLFSHNITMRVKTALAHDDARAAYALMSIGKSNSLLAESMSDTPDSLKLLNKILDALAAEIGDQITLAKAYEHEMEQAIAAERQEEGGAEKVLKKSPIEKQIGYTNSDTKTFLFTRRSVDDIPGSVLFRSFGTWNEILRLLSNRPDVSSLVAKRLVQMIESNEAAASVAAAKIRAQEIEVEIMKTAHSYKEIMPSQSFDEILQHVRGMQQFRHPQAPYANISALASIVDSLGFGAAMELQIPADRREAVSQRCFDILNILKARPASESFRQLISQAQTRMKDHALISRISSIRARLSAEEFLSEGDSSLTCEDLFARH